MYVCAKGNKIITCFWKNKVLNVNQWLTLGYWRYLKALLWRHNGSDGVSNHQHHDCLPNRSFRRRSKKTPKLRLTDLCAENSPVTGEFPAQMASNAEMFPFQWWRHHGKQTPTPDTPQQEQASLAHKWPVRRLKFMIGLRKRKRIVLCLPSHAENNKNIVSTQITNSTNSFDEHK